MEGTKFNRDRVLKGHQKEHQKEQHKELNKKQI